MGCTQWKTALQLKQTEPPSSAMMIGQVGMELSYLLLYSVY
jgi:hypothetical protein